MNEHVLGLLEFPKVCELLSERASSARGRRRAAELRPSVERTEIEGTLDLVRQMREAQLAGHDPGPIEVAELEHEIRRLRLEGDILEPHEILALRSLFAVSVRARSALGAPDLSTRFPDLQRLGARFGDFRGIMRRLEEVFDPGGEFLDTASPELARLRQRLRVSRTEAGEALSSLARRESTRPEETFVTLREGRYVLAVRTHDRSRMPGIVHGHSGSGQTVFLEPFQAVDRNNEIADLESQEHEERIRILREITEDLRARSPEIEESYEAAADLDLLRARAILAGDLRCSLPAFNDGEGLRLVGARHPLLAEGERRGGAGVVPLDLELSGGSRTLILSGPNMGGKTVAVKTVGLVVAMAQAGLFVPAGEGTEIPLSDGIYADVGDEQSIEQETSTYAGHLRNLSLAWKHATDRSIVLLDELGGGTDPDEGTAIGRAILELLTERRAFLIVTTHLSGLKLVAHESPGMSNAAMEFDPTTQKPTYRLSAGAPGRSRAFELLRKIMPDGDLVARAEGYRTPLSARLDDLLADIERRRLGLKAEEERLRIAQEALQASAERKDRQAERLRQRLHTIREARWEASGHILQEAEGLLAEARRIRAETEQASREAAAGRRIELDRSRRDTEAKVAQARGELKRPRERGHAPIAANEAREGSRAFSLDLNATVNIESGPDPLGRVWITHGKIRFQVPLASLVQPGGDTTPSPRRERSVLREPMAPAAVERQIDVRGLSAEDGLERVERTIDRASIAGVPEVRIIHGKGTGTLKRRIEEFLSGSPLVEEFRTAEPREGGWGATIVRVRSAKVE